VTAATVVTAADQRHPNRCHVFLPPTLDYGSILATELPLEQEVQMIFTGRMLANREGITVWQRHQGSGYELHFVNRGVVLDLTPEELAALAAVAASAIEAAGTPEDGKDRSRRLQILQARVTDYVKRERVTDAES
jgi:hypothetical protein